MPANKVSLGIPSQGLHFYTREDNALPERARSWAETVTWTWGSGMAERYGARLMWDSTQAVTYGAFENGGTFGSEATGAAVAAPIAKTILETDRAIRGW